MHLQFDLRVPPREELNLHVMTSPDISPILKSICGALKDLNWHSARVDEFQALLSYHTWDLVALSPKSNVVPSKWIYRHKFQPNGTLACYKARWVLHVFSQQPGIDFDETFSPVVKLVTIGTVLSLVVSSGWPIRQLDVKKAFLHEHLFEVVYRRQSTGFID